MWKDIACAMRMAMTGAADRQNDNFGLIFIHVLENGILENFKFQVIGFSSFILRIKIVSKVSINC